MWHGVVVSINVGGSVLYPCLCCVCVCGVYVSAVFGVREGVGNGEVFVSDAMWCR